MNNMLYARIWSLVGVLAVLSACGGGDVVVNPTLDPSDTQALEVAGLNGIWEGDYTDSSGAVCTDVKGLIYNGSVRAISEGCNIIYAGSLSISGSSANINFDLFDAEGISTGQSSFGGSFTLQSLIDGSLDNGGRLSLRYQTVYENDSSLNLLVATWGFEEPVGTGTGLSFFSIDSAGNLALSSTVSGCNYAATFSILDADYNLYGVSLTITGCTGSLASRNGSYNGAASLSGNNSILTVLAGNDQNVFFADFTPLPSIVTPTS